MHVHDACENGPVRITLHFVVYVGSASQNKVVKWLAEHFKTPGETFIILGQHQPSELQCENATLVESSSVSVGTQTDLTGQHQQLDDISKVFSLYLLREYSLNVPDDFLVLTCKAMAQPKCNH